MPISVKRRASLGSKRNTPEDLQTTLANCDTYTDGFWYFSHDELSVSGTGDLTFGTRAEYREAISAAAE